MKPKTLYYWYREVISNYRPDVEKGLFLAENVEDVDLETGEILKQKTVSIFKPENLGASLNIDEKMIGKRYCTILSNTETGKIALLIETMKPYLVKKAIELFGEKPLENVKNICSDMSPMYKKLCREVFTSAKLTVDKFHVIKQILDILQLMRLKLKNELKKNKENEIINNLGWTKVELLEKSKYILYKSKITWGMDERLVGMELFRHFPQLETAYNLVEEIRDWYDKKNIGKPKIWLEKQLSNWMEKTEKSGIIEFKSARKMFTTHQNEIIQYFENGHTNAKAENLNAKIQRFIINNYGLRDRAFFYYRTQIYFA